MKLSVRLQEGSKSSSTHLVVVWRARAVGTEVAVDWVPAVSFVGIDFQVTLGELEVVLGSKLVQGKFTTRLKLASITVAEDVTLRILRELDLPFDSAAVAVAFEVGHIDAVMCLGRRDKIVRQLCNCKRQMRWAEPMVLYQSIKDWSYLGTT